MRSKQSPAADNTPITKTAGQTAQAPAAANGDSCPRQIIAAAIPASSESPNKLKRDSFGVSLRRLSPHRANSRCSHAVANNQAVAAPAARIARPDHNPNSGRPKTASQGICTRPAAKIANPQTARCTAATRDANARRFLSNCIAKNPPRLGRR